jgi:hypothetical protein
MEFELFDVDGIFKDTIFDKANVTSCTAKILLEVDGVDNTVLYGDVDLSTIEYDSYYDDGVGNEVHGVSFTVFSFLKRLESQTVSDLYDNFVANKAVTLDLAGFAPRTGTWVRFIDVLDELQKMIISGVSYDAPSVDVDWRWTSENDLINGSNKSFSELYWVLSFNSGPSPNPKFWQNTGTQPDYFAMRDVKSWLNQFAGEMLSYPLLKYNCNTDTFQLVLKQRGKGSLIDSANIGQLKHSSLKSFYGYDAVRAASVQTADGDNVLILKSPVNDNGSKISQKQFDVLSQKFDFQYYLGLKNDELATSYMLFYLLLSTGEVSEVANINLPDSVYFGPTPIRWSSRYLAPRFASYWSNPSMYERTYVGVGIGGTYPVEILDRVTIDSVNYTITEIKRNLIDNELSIKAVEY